MVGNAMSIRICALTLSHPVVHLEAQELSVLIPGRVGPYSGIDCTCSNCHDTSSLQNQGRNVGQPGSSYQRQAFLGTARSSSSVLPQRCEAIATFEDIDEKRSEALCLHVKNLGHQRPPAQQVYHFNDPLNVCIWHTSAEYTS